MTQHTILLIQDVKSKRSRTFRDFGDVASLVEYLIGTYEAQLKELEPNTTNITYDIEGVSGYINSFKDISALVYSPSKMAYVPHSKEWIVQKIYNHLKKQVV